MRTTDQQAAALGQVLELAILVNDDMTRSLARDGSHPVAGPPALGAARPRPEHPARARRGPGVSPRNVTGLVDGLVATGFVTREPHPTDRRATLVSFTDRGAGWPRSSSRASASSPTLLFAGMPDRRFDGLVQGLAEVLDRLRAALAPAEARSMRTVASLARRAVAFELAMYRSLFRWVTRRPDVAAGRRRFSYVGAVAVLLWAFIVVSAVELVVVHVLLPWDTVRLVADVLGVWGLVWMLGLAASYSVHPHVVGGARSAGQAGAPASTSLCRGRPSPRSECASAAATPGSRSSSTATSRRWCSTW